MSLQVWIPLNGSNINQGTYGISTSGSPNSWGTGKLGKCATFTGNVGNRITTTASPGIYHRDNFTYAVWLNHNFTGSTAQFAFTVGRADSTSFGYAIQITSATSINCWFGSRSVGVACKANEWHHVAVTVSSPNIKVYVDGILAATSTVATVPTYSEANGLGLKYQWQTHRLTNDDFVDVEDAIGSSFSLKAEKYGSTNNVTGITVTYTAIEIRCRITDIKGKEMYTDTVNVKAE